jgi:hypothetical protein
LKFGIKKDKYVGRNVIEVVVVSSSGPKSLQAIKSCLGMYKRTIQRASKQTLLENPPFCKYVSNYYSTITKVENYKYSCNLFFPTRKYFLQLLTNNVEKYKSKMKFLVENDITIESVCHMSTPQQ